MVKRIVKVYFSNGLLKIKQLLGLLKVITFLVFLPMIV